MDRVLKERGRPQHKSHYPYSRKENHPTCGDVLACPHHVTSTPTTLQLSSISKPDRFCVCCLTSPFLFSTIDNHSMMTSFRRDATLCDADATSRPTSNPQRTSHHGLLFFFACLVSWLQQPCTSKFQSSWVPTDLSPHLHQIVVVLLRAS